MLEYVNQLLNDSIEYKSKFLNNSYVRKCNILYLPTSFIHNVSDEDYVK